MDKNTYKLAVLILCLFLCEQMIPLVYGRDVVNAEDYARIVDKAALSSQEKAISSLSRQLQKKRGTPQEADFLIRLAEVQIQKSAILFRISTGKNHSPYEKSIQNSIQTLTEYLNKFPKSEEFPEVLFSRAKCYGEIFKKDLAKQDYLRLINSHSDFPMVEVARMAVAEIEIAENNHSAAVTQLHAIEKNPESPYYPFALYKLAWSYLNLKEFVKASAFIVRHIQYYQRLTKVGIPDLVNSGFIDNSLSDLALFYLENMEAKSDKFTIENALNYFHKIENGPHFGRLLVSFSKLLAAHNHYTELVYWKTSVIENHSDLAESVEVALLAFQYQYAQRNFSDLKASVAALVSLGKNREPKVKAEILNVLSAMAADLQTLVLKNKEADELSLLTTPLASLYEAVLQIVDVRDPRSIQARLNLAETSFQIKDYSGATQHYRWLVENVSDKDFKKAKTDAEKISIMAISSRFEELKKGAFIPRNLTVVSLSADVKKSELNLNSLLEWVTWIDAYETLYISEKKLSLIDHMPDRVTEFQNFQFEADRALYAAGEIPKALKRMEAFSFKYPKSKNAVPSISLVLDTFMKSKDWLKIQTLSQEVSQVEAWKNLSLAKSAYEMGADSNFKLLESSLKETATAEERKITLAEAEACAQKYKALPRSLDCLILAGKTALGLKDYLKAEKHLKSVILHASSKEQNISGSFLLLASIKEENGQYTEAADYLKSYIEKSSVLQNEVAEKYLHLVWLTKNSQQMKSALLLKGLCSGDTKKICESYQAWNAVHIKVSDAETQDFFKKAFSGPSSYKSLWALAALKGGKRIPFQDKLVLLNRLGSNWENVSPEFQLALAEEVQNILPLAVQELRKMMKAIAPLRADQNAIARRLTLIKDVELAFSKVMLLPWIEIKTSAFIELAQVYDDFSHELNATEIPKGLPANEMAEYRDLVTKLVTPFSEKARDIRAKSAELINQAKPVEKPVSKPSEKGGSHE